MRRYQGLLLVYELPDEMRSRKDKEERFSADMRIVYAPTATWESIGVLVFQDSAPVPEY